MPIYVYQREDGTRFEELEKMSDEPLTECPTTGQPCKRIITSDVKFKYNSKGFYNIDKQDKITRNIF